MFVSGAADKFSHEVNCSISFHANDLSTPSFTCKKKENSLFKIFTLEKNINYKFKELFPRNFQLTFNTVRIIGILINIVQRKL